jgi:putative protease
VRTLGELRGADYSRFDDFYLGDYTCMGSRSLSVDAGALKEAVELLKADGKRVYVSPVAFPITSDLPAFYGFLAEAADLPIDGIELSSVGVADRLLRDAGNDWDVHVGIFANVYTTATARVLKGMGVSRMFANPELTLDELAEMQDDAGLDVIFQVHGKLPLTPTVPCIFKHTQPGFGCAQHIAEPGKKQVLETSRWPENHVLLCYGKLMASGRDVCMIEHPGRLKALGARHFYINTLCEPPEYIEAVSAVYRQALERVSAGEGFDVAAAKAELHGHSPFGFANGFYFGGPGHRFVSPEELAAGAAVGPQGGREDGR